MSPNHRRAALTTGVIGILLAPLIGYLWWIRQGDISAELQPLGRVANFTYVLDDGKTVFSHNDAMQRISVILQLQNCGSDCTRFTQLANELFAWSEEELRPKKLEETPPQGINFLVMQRRPHAITEIPAGWRAITLSDSEAFLTPDGTAPPANALVFIDATGMFRGVLNADSPDTFEKSQNLLMKLTSSQFLYHYLAKQTLMWKKLRGRNN